MHTQTNQPEISTNDIIQYYDECKVDYEIVWHLKSKLSMHYGYWDQKSTSLRSALENMNRQVANLAEISAGDYILDAGCGVGGSAFYLAQNFDCHVHGISLSQKQVDFANLKAREKGMEAKTKFSVNDYTCTEFADESFDLVWALESACHATDKTAFLREAFRILKPQGRLVMGDFFRLNNALPAQERKWVEKWERAWAVPKFATIHNLKQNAELVGFRKFTHRNITEYIMPTVRRLYYCYIPGVICHSFLDLLGRRTKRNADNVSSTLYQYKSFKKNLVKYQLVSAVKA